ncbi:MAG TPA: hypothetical protein VK906_17020 [Egicoccus sp.]|nr:hypothetical protein [Egicoccus sp.]HSK24890.1 hypothetical protein [Egicoccus sp.]
MSPSDPTPVPTSPPPTARPRRRTLVVAAAGVLGALLGFAVSAAIYLVLDPLLETSSTGVRELQGLLWNVVPVGTVAGFVVGVLLASRRRRRQPPDNTDTSAASRRSGSSSQ